MIDHTNNEVKFDQQQFIKYLGEDQLLLNAENMIIATDLLRKYHKLGDIICNHITQDNLLSDQSKLEQYTAENNIEELVYFASTDVKNKTETFFQMILRIVFGYCPESPLSWSDQKALNDPLTKTKAINNFLSEMKDGDYYKICAVSKNAKGIITDGNSMLVYKSSDNNFTFFDPNHGATMNLDFAAITEKIEAQKGEIAIMDNKRFLERHHSKTIDKFKQFMLKKGLKPQDLKREKAYSTNSSDSFSSDSFGI